MASPVRTPNIWAFHVKSGKPGPWEPSSCLPVRRLHVLQLALPLPPPALGGSDGCQSSRLSFVSYLHPPFCVVLMISSIGWHLRCRLLGFQSRLSLLALGPGCLLNWAVRSVSDASLPKTDCCGAWLGEQCLSPSSRGSDDCDGWSLCHCCWSPHTCPQCLSSWPQGVPQLRAAHALRVLGR